MKEKNKEKHVNEKHSFMVIILSIIIVLISIAGIAYARYIQTKNGIAEINIGDIICEMSVTPSVTDNTIINPYCNVTIQNFKDDNVSKADISYKVEVVPKGDFELPSYYWVDTETSTEEVENIVARYIAPTSGEGAQTENIPLTGTLTMGEKLSKTYKIVFVNVGDSDTIGNIDFKLITEQL